MSDHYDPIHQAFHKGWVVLKSVAVLGDGVLAPGAVTMCKISGAHPYVIHFFNAQDGGFYQGNYCKTRAEADEAYMKRVLRFGDSIEPWDTDGVLQNENGQEAENDRHAPRD